jgi:hypothetical protein
MGERKQEGPGDGPVGRICIALVTFYLVAFSTALLYCLLAFWPGSATSQTIAPEDTRTRVAIQRVVDNSPPSNKVWAGRSKLCGAQMLVCPQETIL